MTAAPRPSGSRTRPAPTPSSSASSRPILESEPAPSASRRVPTGFDQRHGHRRQRRPADRGRDDQRDTRRPPHDTDEDGLYALRLLAGTYHVTAIRQRSYEDGTATATVADGVETTRDFSLDAPTAAVDPTELTADVDFGKTSTQAVTVSNGGSLPLDWVARERDQGVILPPLPEPQINVTRAPDVGPPAPSRRRSRAGRPTDVASASLTTIINDPIGDADGSVTSGRSGPAPMAARSSRWRSTSAPARPWTRSSGYVFLDVDRGSVHRRPGDRRARPADPGRRRRVLPRPVRDPRSRSGSSSSSTRSPFEVVAAVPVTFDGPDRCPSTSRSRRSATMTGASRPPWCSATSTPRRTGRRTIGHGTIEPFSDVSWLSRTRRRARSRTGGSQVINVTHRRPEPRRPASTTPSSCWSRTRPRSQQVAIDVTLNVALPDAFGGVSGTVTDAHDRRPARRGDRHAPCGVPTRHAARHRRDDATPTAPTRSSARPAPGRATSPRTATSPVTQDIEIVAAVSTPGADAALHHDPAACRRSRATLEPSFLLPPGRQVDQDARHWATPAATPTSHFTDR